jgi:single-strand DNA-binding protein
MSGVNKVILLGNIGQDLQVKEFSNGGQMVSISLATSESWKDKDTGQKKEVTEWHRVVFFNKLAEIASAYLTKGSKIYVEGSIKTRKYTGKDGVEKSIVEVVAQSMQMLGGDGNKNAKPKTTHNAETADLYSSASAGSTKSKAPEYDDDIPF